MVEPLKFDNGKPHFPLLTTDPALPSFLSSNTHLENVINKNDTRLRLFSGTANPALAQVLIMLYKTLSFRLFSYLVSIYILVYVCVISDIAISVLGNRVLYESGAWESQDKAFC